MGLLASIINFWLSAIRIIALIIIYPIVLPFAILSSISSGLGRVLLAIITSPIVALSWIMAASWKAMKGAAHLGANLLLVWPLAIGNAILQSLFFVWRVAMGVTYGLTGIGLVMVQYLINLTATTIGFIGQRLLNLGGIATPGAGSSSTGHHKHQGVLPVNMLPLPAPGSISSDEEE